ncbi:MAG TPA: hypothetical protein DCO89_01950 [Clostridiales bacterium]|nr:hypothetical protein [Clostridiales bacterium]
MLLESFLSVISNPLYIVAIIFASLGIACALIAKKVTKVVRKTEEVKPDDKLLLVLKLAGLALILFGFILLVIGGIIVV